MLCISACRETLTDSPIDSQTERCSPLVQPGDGRNPAAQPGRVARSSASNGRPERHAGDLRSGPRGPSTRHDSLDVHLRAFVASIDSARSPR
ncbi:hypothetical protein SAMN05428970_2095 [Agromyces sp. CF514]|nr:hypothetical protein SAMN05428970_2095 [Agromyces sp. CF514]